MPRGRPPKNPAAPAQPKPSPNPAPLATVNVVLTPQARRQEVLRRVIAAKEAQENILSYVRFNMPDYTDPSPNPRSRYFTGRHHELMARKLQELEAGRITRVILNLGPRHGKTELASKRFIPWYSGRHPDQSVIFGTYNETFAADIGRAVRDNIQSHEHGLVFPNHGLKDGSEAAQRLETRQGGQLSFVGRGGTITGRGGHLIVIDDPIKDRKEADSKIIRDQLWDWFTQVIMTRQMDQNARVIIIQTRWHEDDLVGRLTDPMNPYYDPDEARQWHVIDLPALAFDDGTPDALGRKPNEALWPEKFPVSFLVKQQRLDPRGFQALYQGRPSASSGAFFMADWIQTYRPDELPRNLRYYAASDHAVSINQAKDKTALVVVGVDDKDNIYVLPDLFWKHAPADVVTEAMLDLIRRYKPVHWWAERGHITKAIGPFLRKRMHEERVYASIVEVTPTADKQTRAQSFQGRMAMRKVFFPSFAPWWAEARDQILKFPNSAHDDLVDALAYIGLGLLHQLSAAGASIQTGTQANTYRAMFAAIRAQEADDRRRANAQGW